MVVGVFPSVFCIRCLPFLVALLSCAAVALPSLPPACLGQRALFLLPPWPPSCLGQRAPFPPLLPPQPTPPGFCGGASSLLFSDLPPGFCSGRPSLLLFLSYVPPPRGRSRAAPVPRSPAVRRPSCRPSASPSPPPPPPPPSSSSSAPGAAYLSFNTTSRTWIAHSRMRLSPSARRLSPEGHASRL